MKAKAQHIITVRTHSSYNIFLTHEGALYMVKLDEDAYPSHMSISDLTRTPYEAQITIDGEDVTYLTLIDFICEMYKSAYKVSIKLGV